MPPAVTTKVDGGVRQHDFNPRFTPRCLIADTKGSHQLHPSTDASMSAISAIVYAMMQLRIPKLKLVAAEFGTELAGSVKTI